jgi:DNA-binding MarR family transcriptional regulator
MPDVKFGGTSPDTRALYLSDEALKQGLDLLFIAARDISAQGAGPLVKARLGRAHARALHFIARNPGLSVAELLDFLKVTKQSLNRVLNDLLKDGFVERKTGMRDRRTRRLLLTRTGAALADAIWEAQRPALACAFKAAGHDAVNGFRKILLGLGAADGRSKGK